jgi:8-oxo-dGTP diphosphatase
MKSLLEVHEKKPEGFTPQVQVAGCYLETDGKFLLLQNAFWKSESGKWGVPAGKLDSNETPEIAAKRELFEETGISLPSPSQLQQMGSLYIRKPEVDYVYHLFKVQLDQIPNVHLSDEHQDYKWVTLKDVEEIPLMDGAREALHYFHTSFVKNRSGASVNAYLILKQDDKVLFQLRKNTGYCDGMWSLVAGHVEDGESATAAMIREAREEIGIEISQLKVVHVIHRKTNRLNVDLFFDCPSWQGTIKNLEPEKCEKLEFFSLDGLPSNIVDYNEVVLKSVSKGEFYSELGWSR